MNIQRGFWAVLGLVVSCASSHGSMIEPIELQWRGADLGVAPSQAVSRAIAALTFSVQPCVDQRAVPSRIGTIEEDHSEVTTKTNVAAFCTQRLTQMLMNAGFRLEASPTAIVLSPELVEFNVTEGGKYHGDVRLRINVASPGRAVVSNFYVGQSKRWGRSHSVENLNEALSNAFSSAVERFLKDDEGFGKAIEAPSSNTTTEL